MAYWLLKSEPDEFSIYDLEKKGHAPWDGIRNHQAKNFLKEMKVDDLAFFYHSSCKNIGIAGIMQVTKTAYPDPLAVDKSSDYFDEKSLIENKWVAVNMAHHTTFKTLLPLAKIKKLADSDSRLNDLILIKKGSRLSVMPISTEQWQALNDGVC
ncbi:EVE domain-containing protein [Oceaniserpentilla sp. 4NH20-0058]|uniref:EVE domain-containing protein n=1 Tax=Oceaniserpentilla sp. 4NH20-0058 TaxID=3127660 RepID=UPI00310405CC